MPLGGTSNHFRTETLRQCGGWDPYNVTEDADLGIRLFRKGWRCRTLSLPTYEEAPVQLSSWMKQRTRWIKGWMQTLLVHSRHPVRFSRELGFGNTIVFHLFLSCIVLSALIHPFFLIAMVNSIVHFYGTEISQNASFLFATAIFNMAGGYSTYVMLAFLVHKKAGARLSFSMIATLPLYWLLISAAAWRALFHLIFWPHKWEKTPHGLSTLQFRFRDQRAIKR